MPDLDRVPYYHCKTAVEWSTTVPSTNGKSTYTVTFDRHSHKNHSVQYDYSCTCMAYKTQKGPCKHIKIAFKQHCGWMQFTEGGEPVVKDGKKVCPRCEKEVETMMWGI